MRGLIMGTLKEPIPIVVQFLKKRISLPWLIDICLPAPALFEVKKAAFCGALTPLSAGLITGIPKEPYP
jgi:hypothetical protein